VVDGPPVDLTAALIIIYFVGLFKMDTQTAVAQCVFIEDRGGCAPAVPPAPIPNNSNSTRAQSKKNRVFVLREFLLEQYPSQMTEGCTVLDVAGGRGDLSFILRNFGGQSSSVSSSFRKR